MIRLGILTGIDREVRILDRNLSVARPPDTSIDIAFSAARPALARIAVAELIDDGAQALVSFGFAGGLDPDLRPGALVVPRAVVVPGGGEIACDDGLVARLVAAGLPAGDALIAGSESPVLTPRDKTEFRAATRGDAVDMESHILAQAARDAGLPFVVVRAVSDDAKTTLPPGAVALIGEDGRVTRAAVAVALLKNPLSVVGFLRAGRQAQAASRSLGGAARALGRLVSG
ncbi:MAG: squalene--hopene cyclase [Alphaproteobacteria bacterium]|nr:squalene--hopene cyclase [Alphaproteobacteria bacterium]